MRPEILNPLFAEVEALKGVGPGIAKALAKLGLTRAIDLAYHLPTGTIDRVRAPACRAGAARAHRHARRDAGRSPRRIGQGAAAHLRARRRRQHADPDLLQQPGWAKKQLPLGEKRTVVGKLEPMGDEWQIVHPEVLEPAKARRGGAARAGLWADRRHLQQAHARAGAGGARARAGAARMDRAVATGPRALAGLALGAGRSPFRSRCNNRPQAAGL